MTRKDYLKADTLYKAIIKDFDPETIISIFCIIFVAFAIPFGIIWGYYSFLLALFYFYILPALIIIPINAYIGYISIREEHGKRKAILKALLKALQNCIPIIAPLFTIGFLGIYFTFIIKRKLKIWTVNDPTAPKSIEEE